jgi:hypothetical protein
MQTVETMTLINSRYPVFSADARTPDGLNAVARRVEAHAAKRREERIYVTSEHRNVRIEVPAAGISNHSVF